MNRELQEILSLALKIFATVGAPVVIAILVASVFAALIEKWLGVNNTTISFVARLGAGVVGVIAAWNKLVPLMIELGEMAFR